MECKCKVKSREPVGCPLHNPTLVASGLVDAVCSYSDLAFSWFILAWSASFSTQSDRVFQVLLRALIVRGNVARRKNNKPTAQVTVVCRLSLYWPLRLPFLFLLRVFHDNRETKRLTDHPSEFHGLCCTCPQIRHILEVLDITDLRLTAITRFADYESC